MANISRRGSTMKQMAYAKRLFGAEGNNKKQIALDVGYAPNVARSVSSHIENKVGFNNAMIQLANESNNLAMAVMHEFKARGFKNFDNKELTNALNSISSAWAKFNEVSKPKEEGPNTNRLRTIILQQVENQTIGPKAEESPLEVVEEITEEEI